MNTLSAFDPDIILNYVGQIERINITLNDINYNVKTSSLRLKCFKNNRVCVCCGVVGVVILLQNHPNSNDLPHFNLYAFGGYGRPILMTRDHIIPTSKGGKDTLNNLQTMCCECNRAKLDKLNISFEEIIKRKNKTVKRKNQKRKRLEKLERITSIRKNISRYFLEKTIKENYDDKSKLIDFIYLFIKNLDINNELSSEEIFEWSCAIKAQILKNKI